MSLEGQAGQPEPTIVDPGTAPPATVMGVPPVPTPATQPPATSPPAAAPQVPRGAPAQPPGVTEVPLEERFEWDEATGTDSATLQELIDARRMLKTYGEDFQTFQRAVAGDPAAIQAIVQKASRDRQTPGATGVTQPTPAIPPGQPGMRETPPAGIAPAEWEQVRAWVERARTNETRRGISEFLRGNPEYHSLALRPDAVDKVITELNRVYSETRSPVTPQVLENVVRTLNNIEVEYLKRVGAEQQTQAGELGLSDLFRGGPVNPPEPSRPDFRKDPVGYKKYLAGRFREAVQAARESGTV